MKRLTSAPGQTPALTSLPTRLLVPAAFAVGLLTVLWTAAGYAATNPLALVMTLLIGAFFVMGAVELQRFRAATAQLAAALADVPAGLARLADWLDLLPPSLRNPVRLRIEGERAGLPGPALAPYLTGLLVLLGMLGTFLGMVVTLKGTVVALESTTDLQSIRASLAAPVKGLGLAFGTSVAGVAASAMLGLMSALCRRERLQAAQLLDTQVAGSLRGFSAAHQREATLQTLESQARVMPEIALRLHGLMTQMERQSLQLNERLLAGQDAFQRDSQGTLAGLAAANQAAVAELSASHRAAVAQLAASNQAAVAELLASNQATVAGLGASTQDGFATWAAATQDSIAGLATSTAASLGGLAQSVERSLKTSLADSAQAAAATVQAVVDGAMQGMAREAAALQAGVAATTQQQLAGLADGVAGTLREAADSWTGALARSSATFEQGSATLLQTVSASHVALHGELAQATAGLAREAVALHHELAGGAERALAEAASASEQRAAALLQTLEQHAGGLLTRVDEHASGMLGQVEARNAGLFSQVEAHAASVIGQVDAHAAAVFGQFDRHSAEMMLRVEQARVDAHGELAASDQQRLAAWTDSLQAMAGALQHEWQQAGEQARAQTQHTLAEVRQLLQAAAEAPRAAAGVIAELRQQLSESIAHDNGLLDERRRIMETLATLLDGVNHASNEQRGAIDALVASSAQLLEQVGSRFGEQVAAGSGQLADTAAQISGSAVEVASLGEAFGHAVQLFSASNDKLMGHLERVEGTLAKSVSRSDEQLAYYVAQAREIIDLSLLSQRQIVEELQRHTQRQGALAVEALA